MAELMRRYNYAIDHKGRLNVPAKIRKALSPDAMDTFVLTRGLEKCLYAYPLDEWKVLVEKLKTLQMTQANARFFVRTLMANASETVLDSQGRIAVPQHLMSIANLNKDAMIIGMIDKLEIWDPAVYESYINDFGITFEEVAETILLKDEDKLK